MLKKNIIVSFISTVFLVSTSYATLVNNNADTQKLINFLISNNTSVGVTYTGTAKDLKGLALPLSYYSTPNYWGDYVCKISGNNCSVTDNFNNTDYSLTPNANSPGAALQTERLDVANGTDIYDAACWQIALALAGSNGLKGSAGENLFTLANNQNILLKSGYDGDANNNYVSSANRAYTTKENRYNYHGITISLNDALNAYFYRMVPESWLSNDPFFGTNFLTQYVQATNLPPKNPDYALGKVSWMDWKPITGESAWAFFISSLQSAYLEYIKTNKQTFIPFNSLAIQNALNILPAFRAMQSQLGAIYYAVPGSLGNTGNQPINPSEVSVENNASALAGLEIFSQVLQQELKNNTGLNQADKNQIIAALNDINTMIYGGEMPIHSDHLYTNGLLNFFKNYAWQNGEFIQGGLADEPNKAEWQPTIEPKAVDVNTWGLTVLGQRLIDQWFGPGAAFNAWKTVKTWGGFTGTKNELMGVGYSDSQQGNASYCEPGNYDGNNSIISAEWTAGAINMASVLSAQYAASGDKDYATALTQDQNSMQQGLQSLRSDHYPSDAVYNNARPANYQNLITVPADKLSYVYASRRCFIPFGWLANPLPSTTSTAWAVMLQYGFNPFVLGGGNTANPFVYGNLSQQTTIMVNNTVSNTQKIAINYKIGSDSNWKYGPQITTTGSVTLPANTSLIQVVYTKDGSNWYPACQLVNPSKITAFATVFGGDSHLTLTPSWTGNTGVGECQLIGK